MYYVYLKQRKRILLIKVASHTKVTEVCHRCVNADEKKKKNYKSVDIEKMLFTYSEYRPI